MPEQLAFDYPPDFGNAVALVAYYAVFFVAQIALGARYLRSWNLPIFTGLLLFLALVILGSVAYLKLHYNPVTGAWYTLWIFTLTAGPAFFIASVHLCMGMLLQDMRSTPFKHRSLEMSSRMYIIICLSINILAVMLTLIGASYAGAKSSVSSMASKPGFDLMVAAMAFQSCGLVIMLITGIEMIASFRRHKRNNTLMKGSTDVIAVGLVKRTTPSIKTVKRPLLFLIGLLVVGVLLFAQTVVRAIDVAGGFNGPLREAVLPNVEAILLFVAILLVTVIHPAIQLQKST